MLELLDVERFEQTETEHLRHLSNRSILQHNLFQASERSVKFQMIDRSFRRGRGDQCDRTETRTNCNDGHRARLPIVSEPTNHRRQLTRLKAEGSLAD